MGKIQDFLENKSTYLMTFFLIVQVALFAIFIILFFQENNKDDIRYSIHLCGSMCLFLMFMIHFAYHSVILNKNKN